MNSTPPIAGNQIRGHLETMILSVLDGQEAHGFEVLRRLEGAGCGALKLKEGSLYPALYRMEKQGLVKARWEEGESGRRGLRRSSARSSSAPSPEAPRHEQRTRTS